MQRRRTYERGPRGGLRRDFSADGFGTRQRTKHRCDAAEQALIGVRIHAKRSSWRAVEELVIEIKHVLPGALLERNAYGAARTRTRFRIRSQLLLLRRAAPRKESRGGAVEDEGNAFVQRERALRPVDRALHEKINILQGSESNCVSRIHREGLHRNVNGR